MMRRGILLNLRALVRGHNRLQHRRESMSALLQTRGGGIVVCLLTENYFKDPSCGGCRRQLSDILRMAKLRKIRSISLFSPSLFVLFCSVGYGARSAHSNSRCQILHLDDIPLLEIDPTLNDPDPGSAWKVSTYVINILEMNSRVAGGNRG